MELVLSLIFPATAGIQCAYMRVKYMHVFTVVKFEKIQVIHLQPKYHKKQEGAGTQDMHIEVAFQKNTSCPGSSSYPKFQ